MAELIDGDAVWNAESGGSREPRIRWQCRCPKVKGQFWGVWPIENHCKA